MDADAVRAGPAGWPILTRAIFQHVHVIEENFCTRPSAGHEIFQPTESQLTSVADAKGRGGKIVRLGKPVWNRDGFHARRRRRRNART